MNRSRGFAGSIKVFIVFFMALGTPFCGIEATGTDRGTAIAAQLEAAAAVIVFTARAGRQAAAAVRIAAAGTVGVAFVAHRVAAAAAAVKFLFAGEIAAVGARLAVPGVQRHKRALGVVGPQDAGHEREEVQQPTLGQRRANGLPALAFAQRLRRPRGDA